MRRSLVAVLLVILFGAASALAEEGAPQGVAYQVNLQGVEDDALKSDMAVTARLMSLANRPPPGMIALQRRADEDRHRLEAVLRSRGFYDGTVDIAIDATQAPVMVTITVRLGEVYRLGAWNTEPDLGLSAADVGLALGDPAVAAQVIKAQGQLLQRLAERAYPLARVVDRRVVVDHATHTMSVTEKVDPGPLARFAAPTITGLATVDPTWVRRRVPWRPGDLFDPAKIEELRKSLADSALFRTISISTAKALDADGQLPVVIDLSERPSHSAGGGLVYSTSEGPGAQAFWEDRNLLGRAERLRLTALGSRVRDLALADYRAPDFFARDKDLLGDLSYEQQNTTAFFTRTAAVSMGIGWRVSPIWSLSAAGALEHTLDAPSGQPLRRFDLASIPMSAKRDTTDDVLDPTRGGRSQLTLRPFIEITGENRQFTRVEFQQTGHLIMLDDPRVILALWGNVGSILNSKTLDLPADKRFYAGGGGSVRGYKLYFAGPLNAQGQPAGGRSLLGFGSELRIKVTDKIGIAPFFEGANVYATPRPQFEQRLFYGTGLGLRYYTPVGPVRVDVATPLHRRPGIDDRYEIYVSLGQAF